MWLGVMVINWSPFQNFISTYQPSWPAQMNLIFICLGEIHLKIQLQKRRKLQGMVLYLTLPAFLHGKHYAIRTTVASLILAKNNAFRDQCGGHCQESDTGS